MLLSGIMPFQSGDLKSTSLACNNHVPSGNVIITFESHPYEVKDIVRRHCHVHIAWGYPTAGYCFPNFTTPSTTLPRSAEGWGALCRVRVGFAREALVYVLRHQ